MRNRGTSAPAATPEAVDEKVGAVKRVEKADAAILTWVKFLIGVR
jgi:hypothetical protein